MGKNNSMLKTASFVIKKMFKCSPGLFGIALLLGVFHGVSIGWTTTTAQMLFDEVNKVTIGETAFKGISLFVIIFGISIILQQVLNGLHNYSFNVYGEVITGKLTKEINNKCSKLDPIMFEDTETLNDINKAKRGLNGIFILGLVLSVIVCFYLPYFIYMGIYLYSLDRILAVSIIIIFIPSALSQYLRVKVFKNLEDEAAPIRRECTYYEDTICSREYFKETRILGSYKYLFSLYSESVKLLNKKIWKAEKKTGLLELCMNVLTILGYFIVLLLLVNSLMKGRISVGAFAAVFTSISMMISIMNEIISMHIGNLVREAATIQNYFNFFNLPERSGECYNPSLENGIELRDVYFKYPSREDDSIKGINILIKPKETIAIVGENGSGKSTLVRLIMGLYLPTKGEVLYGDVKTNNISPKYLYNLTSAVFQKYQRYKLTLRDNINISNLNIDNDVEKDLEDALKKGDLDQEMFSSGFDTMLSKEFDGIDLSGGQWQRVAISRGFYKNHELIILDEPTAAIDPIEESKLYNKFSLLSENKTSIIVTHRLGSAKIADKILVMDNGELVQVGSHNELINEEGKYKQMYESQAKWYI
ncbi:MAG: ABC transporter ATP-binding protein [Clostridium sp.]